MTARAQASDSTSTISTVVDPAERPGTPLISLVGVWLLKKIVDVEVPVIYPVANIVHFRRGDALRYA